ncbi:MAG: hypothetical protein HYY04_13020 [Chloroflexi bacterium]|nr:hypothetical protein [Chloroflexota bacterium]
MLRLRRHSHVYDLLEALAGPGCPVCALVRRTSWRYLDTLAYENVNDPGIRARLRAAHGFCNRHAWAFLDEQREALGTAIIARDVLRTLSNTTDWVMSRLAAAMACRGPCPTCAAEQTTAAHVLGTLAETLAEEDVAIAYRRSDGLCVPHLLQTASLPREADRRRLATFVLEHWTQTTAERTDSPLVRRAVGEAGVFGKDTATLDGPEPDPEDYGWSIDPELCPVCRVVREAWADRLPWTAAGQEPRTICGGHAWPLLGCRARGGPNPRAPFLSRLGPTREGGGALPPPRVGKGATSPPIPLSVDGPAQERPAQGVRSAPSSRQAGSGTAGPAQEQREGSDPLAMTLLRGQIQAAHATTAALLSEKHSPIARSLETLGLLAGERADHRMPCVACAEQRRIEASIARQAAAPLCLPHLRRALEYDNQSAWLATRPLWRRLEVLLGEYIRKQDYRFRDEPRGEEQMSPWLATLALVGEPGVR